MRLHLPFYIFLLMAFAASCDERSSGSSSVIDPQPMEITGIECTVMPQEYEESRSELTMGTSGMDFAWQYGDKITVYSDASNKGDFTLSNQNGPSATFDGGGFHVIDGSRYYSISKSTNSCIDENGDPWQNAPDGFNNDSYTNIRVTYAGQRMTANGSTAHLGQYDYMVATGVAEGVNHVGFKYQHLGLTLRLEISGLPSGKAFKSISMFDATDNSYREMNRSINLSNGLVGDVYTPYINEPVLLPESSRFSLDLGVGLSGITVGGDGRLTVFWEVPPVDLTSKTIAFYLEPADPSDPAYFCYYTGRELRAGKAYKMSMTAQACTQYMVNLKVMHDWHSGTVASQSRSNPGDPGYAQQYALPQYLYWYLVDEDKVVETGSITAIPAADWETTNGVSAYRHTLVMNTTSNVDPKLYVIASDRALSLSTINVNDTEETLLSTITYDYVGQEQMKNLYATPSCATYADFAGALTDNIKDVRLWHVASKVDVNWESDSALSGSASISGVPSTGLSMFQPTQCGGAGTISDATQVLDEGSAYSGNAAFYMPQPATSTFRITVGSSSDDVVFTSDPVYTSWLRTHITIQ